MIEQIGALLAAHLSLVVRATLALARTTSWRRTTRTRTTPSSRQHLRGEKRSNGPKQRDEWICIRRVKRKVFQHTTCRACGTHPTNQEMQTRPKLPPCRRRYLEQKSSTEPLTAALRSARAIRCASRQALLVHSSATVIADTVTRAREVLALGDERAEEVSRTPATTTRTSEAGAADTQQVLADLSLLGSLGNSMDAHVNTLPADIRATRDWLYGGLNDAAPGSDAPASAILSCTALRPPRRIAIGLPSFLAECPFLVRGTNN